MNKPNKKFNKIFFACFVIPWFVFAIINIAAPERTFSENENRTLSSFPILKSAKTLVEGDAYMKKVDTYINDQFVLRDTWISLQSTLEFLTGKRENNGVYIADNALISKLDGPNDEYIESNISAINTFNEKYNIKSSIILVPSASEIQSDRLPRFACPWEQKEVIDNIYGKIKNADCISVYDTLSSHKDEYIFYRTDHHWTTYGAYLAYVEYCNAKGITPADYKYDTVSRDFNGTLYSKSGVRFTESDTIEAYSLDFDTECSILSVGKKEEHSSVYFEEYLGKKDKYAYFLGTNQPVITVKGNIDKTDKLLIFKDSYAHCLTPMLLEHYGEITLVDLRYIKNPLDRYFDVSQYDSALFLYSTDTFVNYNDLKVLPYIMPNNTTQGESK